jgi:putative ABC transport system substrate-binding protein
MRELGYVKGQNLVIEYRSAKGKPERRAEIAAELVRLKVDVIVTAPFPALIRAAQRATRTIPIVISGATVDPVEAGFVVSLARPGGNITGLTNLNAQLHAKRLELLKEAFPRISRVAIIWSPDQQKRGMTKVKAAAQALGIEIQSLVVETRTALAGLESAFSTISQERPDALLVATTGGFLLTPGHRAWISEFTAKRQLPTIYSRSRFVKEGGLMSYGANLTDIFRRTATYVDKILKGAKPADLPVERATKFELVINLKTAKKLGLTIPPEVLFRADKVIK